AAAVTSATLLATQGVAQGAPSAGAGQPDGVRQTHAQFAAIDARTAGPVVAPTSAQLDLRDTLHATVRGSPLDPPQSMIRYGDVLASDVSGDSATAAARAWLDRNRALYRLESVDGLRAQAEVALTEDAYVVVLRQYVDGLPV